MEEVIGKKDGDVLLAPATVPKKRGRPSNPDKPKKVPTGRGRGRPSKSGVNNVSLPKKVHNADRSDDEDGGPFANGSSETSSYGRGRPPKIGKLKLSHSIEATGKGRGRPKKIRKADLGDEDDEDDDHDSADYKPNRKNNMTKKPSKKGRGRPKKIKNSDEESSDDKNDDDDEEDERRPVGRPSSGGINLNIERTGRGQGRPKKELATKRSAEGNDGIPKKRGRPSSSGKAPYVPTGKARGRPRLNAATSGGSQDEADYAAKSENSNNSADSGEDLDRNANKSENSNHSADEEDVRSESDKDDNDD